MKTAKSGTAPDAAEGARRPEFVRVRGAREHNLKDAATPSSSWSTICTLIIR